MTEICIQKGLRLLELSLSGGSVYYFPIALGKNPQGPKQQAGDNKTPEGEYFVCTRNEQSKYHLFLGLSYPNQSDATKALQKGYIEQAVWQDISAQLASSQRPPWDTILGGAIGIHGGGLVPNWTAGCIALTDDAMDFLWPHVSLGTKVQILP
jgi:murein L,D-transpeptidase YafK